MKTLVACFALLFSTIVYADAKADYIATVAACPGDAVSPARQKCTRDAVATYRVTAKTPAVRAKPGKVRDAVTGQYTTK